MKRLEAITRSPVYNICGEITDGLTCIRAFNQESMFIREFRQAVDFNAGIMINSFSITKWLSFRLGLLTTAFATLVTIVCMLITPVN